MVAQLLDVFGFLSVVLRGLSISFQSLVIGGLVFILLAELSHIPIALLGVIAGWSRWLELRLPERLGKGLSWLWPICFALFGAWLLNYRES